MNGRRKLEASLPKRKETEENGKSGSVSLPELPQPQAGTESDKMPRAQVQEYPQSSLLLVGGGTELGRSPSPGSIAPRKERGGWLWFSFSPAHCCEGGVAGRGQGAKRAGGQAEGISGPAPSLPGEEATSAQAPALDLEQDLSQARGLSQLQPAVWRGRAVSPSSVESSPAVLHKQDGRHVISAASWCQGASLV